MSLIKSFDVVSMGYTAVDQIYMLERYPEKGEKCRILSETRLGGGQAGTASIALSRWGCSTLFVGSAGDDEPGIESKAWLDAEGVCTDGFISIEGASTQRAFIFIEGATGERTIFWRRDPNLDLKPAYLKKKWFERSRILLIDGHEFDACLKAARWIKRSGGLIVLDAEELPANAGELLSLTDVCVASSEFGRQFFGASDPSKTVQALLCEGVRIAGVTLGPDGALADWGEGLQHLPGFGVKAVDTTGAGDIFHAGICYGLLRRFDSRQTFRFANAAAALSCRKIGGRSGIPEIAEINELLNA